jgi:tetratricopeptide (TPR) repeat protein
MASFILLLTLAVQPLTLQNFFTVVGNVRDDSGSIVTSIRVSLEDENSQPIRTVFVDSSGRFSFSGLRAGNYVLRVETVGLPYEEYSQSLPLQSMTRSSVNSSTTEDTTPVDIILRRKRTASGTPIVVFAQVVPPTAKAEYNRGALVIRKESDAGILALKKAVEIFPDYYDALDLLGKEYAKQAHYQEAMPILLHAIEINNKAYSSMYSLGVALLKLNNYVESISWLQKAAEGDPGNPNIYIYLGLAYGNNRALNESETALKKAYQLGGAAAADAHLYLAGLYNKQERYGEAWRQLELYLKEAKGLKDKTQINTMITNLKAKEKAKNP